MIRLYYRSAFIGAYNSLEYAQEMARKMYCNLTGLKLDNPPGFLYSIPGGGKPHGTFRDIYGGLFSEDQKIQNPSTGKILDFRIFKGKPRKP